MWHELLSVGDYVFFFFPAMRFSFRSYQLSVHASNILQAHYIFGLALLQREKYAEGVQQLEKVINNLLTLFYWFSLYSTICTSACFVLVQYLFCFYVYFSWNDQTLSCALVTFWSWSHISINTIFCCNWVVFLHAEVSGEASENILKNLS